VIYEHEELWWNYIDRGKHSSTRAFGNPTSSHLVAKQDELGEGNYDFVLLSIFVHTSKLFFICRKILRHGTDGFTSPPKKGVNLAYIQSQF
jgi:hypothetical protein